MWKIIWILCLVFGWVSTFSSQIPLGYYSLAEGKKEAALKTSLHQSINNHTPLEYYASATYFRTTDWHPDGYFWDMYSSRRRTSWGSGLNREHSMPKSWWSTNPESTIAYTDLHNLYPSDMETNTAKSNFALGVVGSNRVFDNSVSKVGNNIFPGYQGTVFEPADEYKGDFARTYMYMVTRYEDYATFWRSIGTESMLSQNTFPVFRTYAVNLLMQWHRTDPVSSKEINRNNAVFSFQRNRNPFIDHPMLAEYLWGNRKGSEWNSSLEGNPANEMLYVHFRPTQRSVLVGLSPASAATYHIFALNGQKMLTGTLSATTPTNLVPVNELATGTFLFMVETEHNTHVRVFLVF